MDRFGTYFIPDGETRTLVIVEDWLAYRNGNLFMVVGVEEAETEDPLLLNQYSAEDLYLALRQDQPDPGTRVQVSRDGSYFEVEVDPEAVENADDAM